MKRRIERKRPVNRQAMLRMHQFLPVDAGRLHPGAGMRNDVIVMVGGAPVTQEYADAVGADGYAADASATVNRAKSLLEEKRAKVPA